MHNRIYVTSPGRKHKCNIPDDASRIELDFNPITMMTPKREGKGREQNTERPQDSGEETHMTNNQNRNTNGGGVPSRCDILGNSARYLAKRKILFKILRIEITSS
jgi:hypothetical protein